MSNPEKYKQYVSLFGSLELQIDLHTDIELKRQKEKQRDYFKKEIEPSPADTMFIAPGSGALDFSITLHAEVFDPDVVTGELTGPNVITIPEQTIGFFPGSGEITFSNNRLSLVQRGLGLTCRGSDYIKY